MKKLRLAFIFLIITSLLAASVTASSGIRSAAYLESSIYLDGEPINLENPPALLVSEGVGYAVTYVPVREIFEKLGYSVAWVEADRSVRLESPRGLELPLVASADGANLYTAGYGGYLTYFLLEFEGLRKPFGWYYWSMGGNPELLVSDFDNDGNDEAGIILQEASGTGVSLHGLHIVEYSYTEYGEADLIDYTFNDTDYLAQAYAAISYSIDMSGDIITLACDGKTLVADISNEESVVHFGGLNKDTIIVLGNEHGDSALISYFSFGHPGHSSADNGAIYIVLPIAVKVNEQHVLYTSIGELTARVNYSSGEFTLSDFELWP